MKNETARREIESLDYYLQNHTNDYSEESHTAMMMAVKALEQQPCEDCISREEVIKHLENITMDTNPDHYDNKDKWYQANGFNLCKVGIEIYVKNLPLVTPKPKTGRWEDCSNGWMCSNCYKDVSHESDFCPNCGADMRGEENAK